MLCCCCELATKHFSGKLFDLSNWCAIFPFSRSVFHAVLCVLIDCDLNTVVAAFPRIHRYVARNQNQERESERVGEREWASKIKGVCAQCTNMFIHGVVTINTCALLRIQIPTASLA